MVNFDQILESTLGILPTLAQSWGGPHDGDGGVCDACNKPITKRQLLMEDIASTLGPSPHARDSPVTLPPGRARLLTSPIPTGSLAPSRTSR